MAKTFKQNIITELYLEPMTIEQYGQTKRLLFRRRQKMIERNLIIIYFDGVMGDLCYSSG